MWTIADISYQYLSYYILLCLLRATRLLHFIFLQLSLLCLCGNPIWWWLRLCHWFRWHICHTHVCQQLLLLGLVGLQGKASVVDFLAGWFICLSWHCDLWPCYHLLPFTLPINVTLDSLTAQLPPLLHTAVLCAWLQTQRNMTWPTDAAICPNVILSTSKETPQEFNSPHRLRPGRMSHHSEEM